MDHHHHHHERRSIKNNIKAATTRTQSVSSSLPSSSGAIIIDDEDPFSSLSLLDPSHEISQSSKEAGRIAGRTKSFNEGRSIGRTKGWEVGLELGYMSNFCSEILNGLKQQQQQQQVMQHQQIDQSSNIDDGDDDGGNKIESNIMQQPAQQKSSCNRINSRLDRCTTLARDIVTLIHDFPPPQHLLHNQDDDDGDVATENNNQQQGDPTALDISTSIQRIRAKFKLLSVLLKTGQSFDIKRILELKGESDEGNHDDDGVDAEELQKDDDVVVRSRNHNSDIEHTSNGGGDW